MPISEPHESNYYTFHVEGYTEDVYEGDYPIRFTMNVTHADERNYLPEVADMVQRIVDTLSTMPEWTSIVAEKSGAMLWTITPTPTA